MKIVIEMVISRAFLQQDVILVSFSCVIVSSVDDDAGDAFLIVFTLEQLNWHRSHAISLAIH